MGPSRALTHEVPPPTQIGPSRFSTSASASRLALPVTQEVPPPRQMGPSRFSTSGSM
ncbi:hypothetical protein BC567DRAFT_238121 [Phyllosticta citribraziliensis]